MGAIIGGAKPVKEEEELVVKFPSYYIEGVDLTMDDCVRARQSWLLIVEDQSPEFQAKKQAIQATSCVSWFYDSFYTRLFEVAPTTKPLFKNDMIVQGKALVKMITAALGLLNETTQLVEALQGLAWGHAGKGVVSSQYGVVGETLLWTLAKVLGEAFTDEVKTSWLKIYCVMLSVILPAAVDEEKKMRAAGKKA